MHAAVHRGAPWHGSLQLMHALLSGMLGALRLGQRCLARTYWRNRQPQITPIHSPPLSSDLTQAQAATLVTDFGVMPEVGSLMRHMWFSLLPHCSLLDFDYRKWREGMERWVASCYVAWHHSAAPDLRAHATAPGMQAHRSL